MFFWRNWVILSILNNFQTGCINFKSANLSGIFFYITGNFNMNYLEELAESVDGDFDLDL